MGGCDTDGNVYMAPKDIRVATSSGGLSALCSSSFWRNVPHDLSGGCSHTKGKSQLRAMIQSGLDVG